MRGEIAAGKGCVTVRRAREGDLRGVQDLLSRSGLPLDGVDQWLTRFLVAEHEGRMVAAAGLEVYEASALLRSVAVEPEWRGTGLGRRLIEELLSEAQDRGITDVYLLTTTASAFFARLGYQRTARDDAPPPLCATEQFTSLCPSSSHLMVKRLPA